MISIRWTLEVIGMGSVLQNGRFGKGFQAAEPMDSTEKELYRLE